MLLNGRQNILNAFESGIFPKRNQGERFTSIYEARIAKVSDHQVFNNKQLKISTPKQMFQRLPTALAQIKVDNTSEHLPNEIKQIIYSLY